MSNRMAPLQPFYITGATNLSDQQTKVLLDFYQPLIGPISLSIYWTFINQKREDNYLSSRFVHNQLIEHMSIALHELDNAITNLEAIGLLKTYRDPSSHEEVRRQTIYYQLVAPLDAESFLKQPHLLGLLQYKIGTENIYRLVNNWREKTPDLTKYDEITTSFQQVFQLDIQPEAMSTSFTKKMKQPTTNKTIQSFDYAKFLKFIMADQINHQEITNYFKETILSLHSLYNLNESQMAEVVKLAKNQLTGKIELDKLSEIIKKRWGNQTRSSHSDSIKMKKVYSKEETTARTKELETNFPTLSKEQISIVLLCEIIPVNTFLTKTKEAKKGFPSDSEFYYISELQKKSQLSDAVINFLIYYLLAIKGQANILKGVLERTANHWQQNNWQKPEEILEALNKEAKVKQLRQKQDQSRKNPRTKKPAAYQAPIPEWLSKEHDNQEEQSSNEIINTKAQEDIRMKLAELYEEGDK